MPHVRAAARFGCAHDLRLAYGAGRQEREREEEEDAGEEKLRGLDTHAAEWVNGDMGWRWGWDGGITGCLWHVPVPVPVYVL